MIFVGVDPGSITMGVAGVGEGGQHLFRTTLAVKGVRTRLAPYERIRLLGGWFGQVLDEQGGEIVLGCIEEPFFTRQAARSSLVLTGAFWEVVRQLHDRDIRVETVKPSQVKKRAGVGPRGKDTFGAAAYEWQIPVETLTDHEADALWIAMCGLDMWQSGGKGVSLLVRGIA